MIPASTSSRAMTTKGTNHDRRTTESASQGPARSGAGLRHPADDADDRPHRKPAIGGYRWRPAAQEYDPREPRIVRPGHAGGPHGIEPYARPGVCHAAGDGAGNGSWHSAYQLVPGRRPRAAGVALISPETEANEIVSDAGWNCLRGCAHRDLADLYQQGQGRQPRIHFQLETNHGSILMAKKKTEGLLIVDLPDLFAGLDLFEVGWQTAIIGAPEIAVAAATEELP